MGSSVFYDCDFLLEIRYLHCVTPGRNIPVFFTIGLLDQIKCIKLKKRGVWGGCKILKVRLNYRFSCKCDNSPTLLTVVGAKHSESGYHLRIFWGGEKKRKRRNIAHISLVTIAIAAVSMTELFVQK